MPQQYATEANAARNAATLRGNIIRDIQLPDNMSEWTVEQRYQYSRRFAEFVLSHASSFTAGHYNAAQVFLANTPNGYPPAQDTSAGAAVDQFVDEFLNNAATVLPTVVVRGTSFGIAALITAAGLYWFITKQTAKAVAK